MCVYVSESESERAFECVCVCVSEEGGALLPLPFSWEAHIHARCLIAPRGHCLVHRSAELYA